MRDINSTHPWTRESCLGEAFVLVLLLSLSLTLLLPFSPNIWQRRWIFTVNVSAYLKKTKKYSVSISWSPTATIPSHRSPTLSRFHHSLSPPLDLCLWEYLITHPRCVFVDWHRRKNTRVVQWMTLRHGEWVCREKVRMISSISFLVECSESVMWWSFFSKVFLFSKVNGWWREPRRRRWGGRREKATFQTPSRRGSSSCPPMGVY